MIANSRSSSFIYTDDAPMNEVESGDVASTQSPQMLVVRGGVWAGEESPTPRDFRKNPQPANPPASAMMTIALRMVSP